VAIPTAAAKRAVPAPPAAEAVVAVTDKKPAVLQALTAAALLLPGLSSAPAQAAEDDEFSFQYGHYQESDRNLGSGNSGDIFNPVTSNIISTLPPITVDSLQANSKLRLTDRIKFEVNFIQDSWSGATPISTAPSTWGGNNFTRLGETISGASPYFASGRTVYFDANRKPVKTFVDPNTLEVIATQDTDSSVHTMAMASPETRQEGNFKLSYEWDDAALSARGGISSEPDYQSRFTGLGLKLDFNQKRTTLDIGASYSNAYTRALIASDIINGQYGKTFAFDSHKLTENIVGSSNRRTYFTGNREEWGGNLNLTQVITAQSLLKAGVGFTHSAGYLENPYKYVTAFTLVPTSSGNCDLPSNIMYCAGGSSWSEQRPDNRNQVNLSTGWVQHIPLVDAALHLDYNFFHDDWGINAHTFSGDWVQPLGSGWSVTPRIRYYSQSAADFYTPYLVLDNPNQLQTDRLLPSNFSSDHRLSAYGALSGGLTISKQLAKGIRLDAGIEYYTHQGSLAMGGDGEDSFADFSYYLANGSLNVNIAQLGRSLTEGGEHAHHHHAAQHGAPLPAGVMFGHMLHEADAVMVGYRYMYSREHGHLLNGTEAVSDQTVIAQGCSDSNVTCRTAPMYMDMHMHMLDLMYAPTDWLNLMLMPQFMNMDMDSRGLAGIDASEHADHLHDVHSTGGIADTGMYAMFKAFQGYGQNLHVTLGVSAPTGDTAIEMSRVHGADGGYTHYGMQLGSGTWDFKPSLTYSGKLDDWGWGAQVSGTKRMQSQNDSGYALGDNLQTTAWGSYSMLDWLTASVRGIYTTQNSIRGRFNPLAGNIEHGQPTVSPDVNPKQSTADQPGNYGGQFWDLGLGLNATIPDGKFAGHQFSVEWLQPMMENVNGYQLERYGTLNATWSYMF
jgi:hypothetical protein